MANPLERIGAMFPSHPAASTTPAARASRAFREVLETPTATTEPSVLPERLRALVQSISSGERAVDRVIAQAAGGRDFSTPELIAIQARVYRYTQELELVSKLVDKACTSVKQTLQTQV